MSKHSKIYQAVYKQLCPNVKPGMYEEKLKSVTDVVNTVLEQIKYIVVNDGELRLKYIGTIELVKGDGMRTTVQLRPNPLLEAELNYCDAPHQKSHRLWNGEESAELMRLNAIREAEKFLGFEWVARCMTHKFGDYRTAKACKERVDRIRELEAKKMNNENICSCCGNTCETALNVCLDCLGAIG